MALVAPPRRHTKVAAVGSRKRFAEVRNFDAAGEKFTNSQQSYCAVKFNPRWSESLDSPGTTVDFAQLRFGSASLLSLDLDTDASAERSINLGGARTLFENLDLINAPNANGAQYWLAGLSDVPGGTVITTGLATGGTIRASLLVGCNNAVYASLLAATTNTMRVGAGGDEACFGGGAQVPTYIDTDYNYPLNPASNPSQVGRGGGISGKQGEDILPQRASKFGTRQAARASEMNPARAKFSTTIDVITNNGMVAGVNEPLVYTILDVTGKAVWQTQQADTVSLIQPDPVVEVNGPIFLQVQGASGGAFSAGQVGIYGDIRRR